MKIKLAARGVDNVDSEGNKHACYRKAEVASQVSPLAHKLTPQLPCFGSGSRSLVVQIKLCGSRKCIHLDVDQWPLGNARDDTRRAKCLR